MESIFKVWISGPLFHKWAAAVVGLLVIIIVIRLFQRSLTRYIKDADIRYRMRKFIAVIGYLAGILFLLIVFRDRLGNLTVALGMAGAGIAFALQEVITSIAGWVAVASTDINLVEAPAIDVNLSRDA